MVNSVSVRVKNKKKSPYILAVAEILVFGTKAASAANPDEYVPSLYRCCCLLKLIAGFLLVI